MLNGISQKKMKAMSKELQTKKRKECRKEFQMEKLGEWNIGKNFKRDI